MEKSPKRNVPLSQTNGLCTRSSRRSTSTRHWEQAIRLTEMLNIELHDDNLKQFYQALEEVFSSLDHNFFFKWQENGYGGQLKKSTLMRNALSSCHSDILLRQGTEGLQESASNGQRYSRRSETTAVDLSRGALSRQSSAYAFLRNR